MEMMKSEISNGNVNRNAKCGFDQSLQLFNNVPVVRGRYLAFTISRYLMNNPPE